MNNQLDIITVTYGNMFPVIKRTVESLYKFTEQPFHLIIVNNGSTDDTTTLSEKYVNCKVINIGENLGMVKGFNIGLRASTAPFIVRMDHDVEFLMPWKKRFLKLLETRKKTGMVGPRVIFPNGKICSALCKFYIPHFPFSFNNPLIVPKFLRHFISHKTHMKEEDDDARFKFVRKVSHVTGSFFLMKREVFEKVGFADEKYPAKNGVYEDLDYTLRITKAGYKILYDGTVKIVHYAGGELFKKREGAEIEIQQNLQRLKDKWGL